MLLLIRYQILRLSLIFRLPMHKQSKASADRAEATDQCFSSCSESLGELGGAFLAWPSGRSCCGSHNRPTDRLRVWSEEEIS